MIASVMPIKRLFIHSIVHSYSRALCFRYTRSIILPDIVSSMSSAIFVVYFCYKAFSQFCNQVFFSRLISLGFHLKSQLVDKDFLNKVNIEDFFFAKKTFKNI